MRVVGFSWMDIITDAASIISYITLTKIHFTPPRYLYDIITFEIKHTTT